VILRFSVPSAWPKVVRVVPSLVVLVVLSGCGGEKYPEDLRYPGRTDPIVDELQLPKQDAPDIDRPGEFPQVLFAGLTSEARKPILKDPAAVPAEQRQALNKVLEEVFGTPASPKLAGEALQKFRAQYKGYLDDEALARGSMKYREQCLHCHGLTGDGRGPTAPWVNPHPRDYRAGKFKFMSTAQIQRKEQKPNLEDLVRTIREGIEGTSMPAFRLLSTEELHSLAGYVLHLSLRGQTEAVTLLALLEDPKIKVKEEATDNLEKFAGYWADAPESQLKPNPARVPNYPLDPDPEKDRDHKARDSVKRGFDLFVSPGAASCISCHSDFGRQSPWKYDGWGTIVRPADLTAGVYRGGRRPIDLYWRIATGINVSGMTSYKDAKDDSKGLSDEKIWDLVHFLQILPYPQMRKAFGIRLERPESEPPEKGGLAGVP
jgi:mono/diheme cytochrome c family protein